MRAHAMIEQLLPLLVEQGPLLAVLGASGYILWKRYDTFTRKTGEKLEEAEKRMRDYMDKDREMAMTIIRDNTEALRAILKSNDRTNKVMECMIEEVKDFKKSEVYLHFKGTQK